MLIAGAADEVSGIAMILGLLPEETYGQVFIEVGPEAVTLPPLAAPARVSVYAVPSLSVAVARWAEEWLPAEPDPHREVEAWLGAGVGEIDTALALCAQRLSTAGVL